MNDILELSAMLQFIEEIVVLLSENGNIIFINESALSLYRWEYNNVVSKSFSELLEKDALPSPLPEKFTFSLHKDTSLKEIETNVNGETQKTISWKLTSYKIDKKNDGILLIGKDITEIRQAEEKIFELDSIIAQTPGNLYWFSKDNIYLGCNEHSAKLLGMSRSEVVDQDFRYLMSSLKTTDHTLVDTLIAQGQEVIATGKPLLYIEEPPFAGVDNKFRYYLANKVPLRNKEGEIYGVIGISTDITYLKELEESLRNEKEKTMIASQSKSEFIANMSHDLRTPITGMLGMVQDMINTADEAKVSLQQQECGAKSTSPNSDSLFTNMIETVQRDGRLLMSATSELLQLCNEILEVVRLELATPSERLETFDLRELMQHNIALLQPVKQHKHLDLSYEISENIPDYLKGLRIYFDRILLNLITNALKFTEKGFVKVTVKILENTHSDFRVDDKLTLKILVEDSGIGIPKDKFNTIFEHFSRLTPAYQGLYKGAGLGLYTVKRYVEAMDGTITLDSEVGKGTTFIVVLPFIIADHADRKKESVLLPNAIKSFDEMPAIKAELEKENAKSEGEHAILIVEDNTLAAIAIQIMLKPFNYRIDFAETGQQAVKMAGDAHYDLILMDIGLPDFNGIEATKKIRAFSDPKKSKVPIVALTGHATDLEKRQESLDAGMQDILSKPAQFLALESIFQEYVSKTATVKKKRAQKSEEVIDWDACVHMFKGDNDFTRRMLSLLAEDLKTMKQRLDKFYTEKDLEPIRDELHKIRGGVCYLKLPQLEKALEVFHEAVKAAPENSNQLAKPYNELYQAIETFWETLESGAF